MDSVTEKKAQKLINNSHLQLIAKMAGCFSHDLSNLLSSITIDNQLSLMSENPEEIIKHLQSERKAIEIMKEVLATFQNLIENQKNKQKLIEPLKIIESILEILKNQIRDKDISITINKKENIVFFGDPGQYALICLNLVLNAIDAMKKGDRLLIALERDSDFMITHIKDTGCGISPENLEKIFDFSFTTKPEGSGMGLFSIITIVRKYGGKINVKSKLGKGSKFSFYLPLNNLTCEKYLKR